MTALKIASLTPRGTALAASIELRDIGLELGNRRILHGINFSTRDRRIGIVGRNGSGKTTLAKVIAGLVAPTTGSARISGVDVAKDRKAALRHVGILFQNPDHQIIFPTVEEEIAFGLLQLGQSKSEAAASTAEILARFERSHWARAATHTLSHGQKQLVCLMSILTMHPALIVLDEPFAGLDIPTRMQLMRHLDGVEASLILITHDPAHLRDYDRVIWLDDGALREDGPAAGVLDRFEQQMRQWGQSDDLADLRD
ncbi:energy-coupling factor ABC transporter ATP-binding protein [Actibacterium sp.]|uniref:energy-coupling factor ABC transporter ATP-binding protein n=1 Tax=Actibacterium sp. TaxID=1872125 RepID=UPI0035691562